MRSPSMPNLFRSSSPCYPPEDLHIKLGPETPHFTINVTVQSIIRTFNASKLLHQVLGIQYSEPFVPPPAMPADLRERLESGLRDNEYLHASGVLSNKKSENSTASMALQYHKTALTDISEEKESPTVPGAGEQSNHYISKWVPGEQTATSAQQYADLDSDIDSNYDTTSAHTNYEVDAEASSLWTCDTSSTLADSRPRSSANVDELAAMPMAAFPPRTSSLVPPSHMFEYDGDTQNEVELLLDSGTLSLSRTASNHPKTPTGTQHSEMRVFTDSRSSSSTLQRTGSLPVLPPSSKFGQQARGVDNVKDGLLRKIINVSKHHGHFSELGHSSGKDIESAPVPRIINHDSSPGKAASCKKRACPPWDQEDSRQPLTRRARCGDVAGLPVLRTDEEELWKVEFPGNTHALLTVLLTWSHAMWSFYHQLPDSKLFSIHPAFPCPLTLPIRRTHVSVGFYDTSVEPHKELRFLGPDDAAGIWYHEVDVFSKQESSNDSQASLRSNPSLNTIRKSSKHTPSETTTPLRYLSMSQRARTGQGRWCYILIKGHTSPEAETPPHLILAWHMSAITASSDGFHTIYPDNALHQRPAAPAQQSKLKRFASLQNLRHALRTREKSNLHHSLRAANSSAMLPPAYYNAGTELQGGVTLHCTVLKMGKAGRMPLIEGFRVDVSAFRSWMEACGKGNGKVALWREMEIKYGRAKG